MGFNIEQLLNDISIQYKKKEYIHNGSPCIRYEFTHCFFDKSHTNNDSCIFQYENGAFFYKCQHNSCKEKKWKDVRDFLISNYGIKFGKYWLKNHKKEIEEIPLQFTTFYEICKKPVERKSIIDGFIDEGDQTIISGSGGVGKSMLIFDLAYRLSSFIELPEGCIVDFNHLLFDKFLITQQRSSLFIQSENNRNQINIRLNKMAGENLDNKEALKKIVSPVINDDVLTTGRAFQDKSFQQWIIDLIHKIEDERGFKLDLLFVDPLISYISRDENDAASMRKDLDGITQIVHTAKITPVVIHHNTKYSNQYRGSSAIPDWARNMISLTPEENSADQLDNKNDSESNIEKVIKVEHVKCNNFQMFKSFNIRRKKNNTFELVEDVVSPEIAEQCKLVSQALEDLGGKANTQSELAKKYGELSGKSPATCKKHIVKAVDEGFVVLTKTRVKYKKQLNYIYSINEKLEKGEKNASTQNTTKN